MMKAKRLINFCVLLLWFVAAHHCAFEQLFSSHQHLQFSHNATTSSDSSSQSGCPSHPSGDPASHSEGKSCGNLIQPKFSSQLNDASQEAPALNVDSFSFVFSNSLSYSVPFLSSSAALFETAHSTSLSQRAHSLSIAPNAPPVLLA